MENDTIVIIDENGLEREMKILLTTENVELSKQYVFYYDPTQDEGDVYVSAYSEDGSLYPIDDESEWEFINEVFETFNLEDSSHDHDHDENCGCGHHHS